MLGVVHAKQSSLLLVNGVKIGHDTVESYELVP